MKVLKMDEAFKLRPLISIIKVSEFLSLLDILRKFSYMTII